MIENTWLIRALSIGISYDAFWKMNPHIIMLHIKAHELKYEEENTLMYIQGRYFVDSLLCTVGNMFSSKNSKTYEYPSEPYELKEKILTEEEKQTQVDELFANLNAMKERFDAKHNNNKAPN